MAMDVTLRQLRAYLAVLEAASFSEAARAMHLSQAALSGLIKELENRMGVRLLDRTTRSVSRTVVGEAFEPMVRRVLANCGRTAVTSTTGMLTSMGAGAGTSGPEYVLEGSVFVAGALVQWLRDELGLIERSEDIEPLAASVPDSAGVVVVPAFTGLGAPDWDPHARGAILGLTRGTTKAHIARAALEAIALSSTELIAAMNIDLPAPIAALRVDGGATRNNLLMQMQADFAGIPVVRPRNVETTAMGAAFLAGMEAGVWSSRDENTEMADDERVFEPQMSPYDRQQRLRGWRRSVERTLGWASPE